MTLIVERPAKPVRLAAVRALLALGGAVAALGAALLVWGVRQQVAWSDCHLHCAGRSPWPVTAVGILLLLGGGFFTAWTAVAEHAGRVLHPLGHDLDERDRLRRVGRAGVARVLQATEAGTDPVGDPVVEVQLAVEVEGSAPYEVRQRTAVPRGRLDRLHAGRSLPVLVDPHDPERLVVEWA
jgi:hypothetical protein